MRKERKMKIRILKDCTLLDAWKKKPRGYAVLKVTPTAKVEAVATGTRIALVRVSSNADHAARQLEKIREVYDLDPYGMAPRVVVVPWSVAQDPRNEQFFRRAAIIVGV
jgi:hypothetical protein